MNKRFAFLVLLAFVGWSGVLSAQVTDVDGNVYDTITIGTQTWMTENLKTTKYRDGTSIPNIIDNSAWSVQTTGAYCWYNNDIANKDIYGALYNYHTVVDNHNICPVGWHIPTDAEWKTLEMYLGMTQTQADATDWRGMNGAQLKNTSGWNAGGNGTNTSGFSALPGGFLDIFGTFGSVGNNGYWWSSTLYNANSALYRGQSNLDGNVLRLDSPKQLGLSVRCIKGEGQVLAALTTSPATSITQTTATIGGNVTSDGGVYGPPAYGICWSISPNPILGSSNRINIPLGAPFTCTLTGLTANTTYYVRAWFGNNIGIAYGNEINFTTTPSAATTVNDASGNVYNTVTIGTQTWMAENLKTTKYNDGTNISNVTDNTVWTALTTPGYCWYNNDSATYKSTYGALYNWYTVNTGKLCPTGWHVPTDAEWTVLTDYLGGEDVAGNKLIDNSWDSNASNETGFSALPGGFQGWNFFGAFSNMGYSGQWWSSTATLHPDGFITGAWYWDMRCCNLPVRRSQGELIYGYSVRCLWDSVTPAVIPTLTTTAVSTITETTATTGGNVSSDGRALVTARGVCYSTSPNPTTSNEIIASGTGSGSFVSELSGLIAGTTYYVRAYATNSTGTGYGNEISFIPNFQYGTLSDNDGNVYKTIQIGTQIWMAENLKTTKYNDGTDIPLVEGDGTAWAALSTPGYCWYNNDTTANKATYGALYNWYSVNTGKLCPTGWHVPTDAEWTVLTDYLGGETVAGGKLKEAGLARWVDPNTSATNETGFSALPGGLRNYDGAIGGIGDYGIWWSSTEFDTSSTWYRNVSYDNGRVNSYYSSWQNGFSVRCLMGSEKAIIVNDGIVNEAQPLEVAISTIELTANDNITSYQFDVAYDITILQYTGNTITGTIAAGGTVDVNTSVAGKLSIGYINTTAILSAGSILQLQFNALTADTTVLTISNAYLNSDSIENLTNGRIIIKDIIPPTAAITYNDTDVRYADQLTITATFSEAMLAANSVKLNLSGAATLADVDMTRQSATVYTFTYDVPKADGSVTVALSNGTDLWSNTLLATPTSGATFTIVKMSYGDVDDNGKILAYDAALTLQRSVGLDPLPAIDPIPWENWRDSTANVDAIAGITANDAAMILQYSIGKISSFTAQTKKSSMSVSMADVTVEVVGTDIVFFASGDLLGLNISTTNKNQILGTPVVVANNFLSAFNIGETIYKLGLCTSSSPASGAALLKIPYNRSGSVTFDLMVNAEPKQVTVDLATGIVMANNKAISVYPNPVNNILYINGLEPNTNLTIYDLGGKVLISQKVKNNQIDVSSLQKGIYSIQMEDKNGVVNRKFVKE
jgi:uncharacterized protein (TIGR02145 family)